MDNYEKQEQICVELLSEYIEKISCLEKCDALSRRNVLKDIHNNILANELISFQNRSFSSLLRTLVQSLIPILSDSSEKCREITIAILKIISNRLPTLVLKETLPVLFKVLVNRLGKTDEREQSEEIRILEMEYVTQLVDKYDENMLPYLTDISLVLGACIADSCPEIKRKSCECLLVLSTKAASHLHLVAQTLMRPLILSIDHQHLKTRALAVKALGCIMDHLRSDDLEFAVGHLARRLFDYSPVVRHSVTEVMGTMLLTLRDRYSYFHHLIPMMLSTIHDEVPEISLKGKDLWCKVGSQYLEENEADYKHLIDFPSPEPNDYPYSEGRPLLGCRLLVQRNVHKIIPPLLSDLSDWVTQIRVKCSKVLFSVILHSEEKITNQLSSVLSGVVLGAKDDSKECVEMAHKSAELLGYFVDPNLLCDTIMTLMHKRPSAAHLSTFAAILGGYTGVYSKECFQGICKFLSESSISRLREEEEQASLLFCVEALLTSRNAVFSAISEYIIVILSSVSALTSNDAVLKKADDLFKQLAEIQSVSLSSLFQQHSLSLLKSLSANNELWNSHSSEMPIFIFIVQSGSFNSEAVELILPIFINNLHPSKEAKLHCNLLSLLVPFFQNLSPSVYEEFSDEILKLIRSGIFPDLSWNAGRTASKLRTLATASLLEIISKSSFSAEMLKSIGEELLSILTTLANDDETSTRLLSCKVLEIILPQINNFVEDRKIHNTCFEILHCMDDESDEVRMVTVRVLKAYVESFPNDYNWNMYRPHLKAMYENVFIHMDDKNEKIRQCVLNLLKEIGCAAPDVLLDEVESKRYMMASSDLCTNLIQHIKNI